MDNTGTNIVDTDIDGVDDVDIGIVDANADKVVDDLAYA